MYPIQFKEFFEKSNIDVNAPENLRAVHPTIHSYITNIQNDWFNAKVNAKKEMLRLENPRWSSAFLTDKATKIAYKNITLTDVLDLEEKILNEFGTYMAEATSESINAAKLETKEIIGKLQELTKTANTARKGLGIKLLAGGAAILAFIDGLSMVNEIVNPSADTQMLFKTMKQQYAACLSSKQAHGYINKLEWEHLDKATLNYMRAIGTDERFMGVLSKLFLNVYLDLPD